MTQATNSLGWEIQSYTSQRGWVAFLGPYPTVDDAHAALRREGLLGNGYFRVYESLDHPSIKKG